MRRLLSVSLFVAAAAFTLTPWATPSIGLAAGAVLALILGNPAPRVTARAAKWLLQAAIVGLGFGIPLGTVLSAGATGIGFTAFGIVTTITLGLLLGRWLRVDWETSLLLTAGTSICGGSAIAAVGPAIGASTEAMSISLATVFVLNAVALYVFPPIGHLLHFSQHQFAVWSAIAIHDTSSVVGAASHYGPRALEEATVLKLTRTLWIIPFSIVAAAMARRRNAGAPGAARLTIPWFIGAFVLAALARSVATPATAAFDGIAHAARVALVLTLFLIGAGLSRETLRVIGARPLVQGVVLWVAVSSVTLAAVVRWTTG